MCASFLFGERYILTSSKSSTYTWVNLLPEADFTPAIMVSVYILPWNRLHRNIACHVLNCLVRGIVTSWTAFWSLSNIVFLVLLILIHHICVIFHASTFGIWYPDFIFIDPIETKFLNLLSTFYSSLLYTGGCDAVLLLKYIIGALYGSNFYIIHSGFQ